MKIKLTKRLVEVEGATLVTREDVPGVEVFTYERNGVPYAYYYRSARQLRPMKHNSFRDDAQRDRIINGWFETHRDNAQWRAKKDANKKLPNPIKVGDIFLHTWGYDQTNNDFYLVVEVKNKQVILRRLEDKIVRKEISFMTDEVMADPKNFKPGRDGAPFAKLVQFDAGGKPYIKMASYGWCGLWDGTTRSSSYYG